MNRQRLRAVFGVDLGFHFKRPLIWVLIVLLALMTWGLSGGNVTIASGDSTVGGDSRAWLTSEYSVGMIFPLIAFLFYVFFVAVAAGMAVPRDDELRVGPLLHSTRLRPAEYVWGKFAAVFVAFLGVLAAHLLFQMFFNHLWPHAEAEELRGPFQIVNYLRPALFLALPCLLFFCGSTFAIGELTRKPILIFLTPVVAFLVSIFFLMDWSPAWLDPRINRLLMWIEPSGYRWINETWIKLDRGVDFYNTTPVLYDVPFLLSRLAYALAGLGLVALSARHFAATLRGTSVRRGKKRAMAEPASPAVAQAATVAPVASLGMTGRPPGFVRAVLEVARFEARNLASQPGLYLFVPIILLQSVFNLLFAVGAFDTPLLITPGNAAVGMMNSLTLMVCLLLMFYTVESVLRERTTGLAQVFHATPSRTGALLFGKAVANGAVGAVILLAAAVGTFVVTLIQGGIVPFELRPFLLVWGLALLPTFLVWSSFVTALVAVTGSRYATYAGSLVVLAFTGWKQTKGEMSWVGNWDLWGVLTWTDFGSVEPNGTALLLNRLFYIAVMAFLVALAVRIFPRREHDSGAMIDRLRPLGLLRAAWRMAPVVVPAVTLGVLLYVKVGQGYQSETAEKHAEDYWSRNVMTWHDSRPPEMAGVDLDVKLEPRDGRFHVTGWYDLVNATDEEMKRFPMSVGDHFENIEWTLDGEEYEPEDRADLFVFDLEEPMAPGDTVRVGFSHEGTFPRGFTKNGGGMGNFILPTGVVLTSFNTGFLPMPFFEEGRGVDEDNETEPKDWPDDFYEGLTPPALTSGVRFPVRTRISGPEEYRYHGVGVLEEETVRDGVRTEVWQTDAPVNFFNIVAGKWDEWDGDGVQIYYHPKHTFNVEEMGEALEASRKYYSEWFTPYPWQDLRLNEFPGIASYAQGFPTNITFSENIGFLTQSKKEANAAFLVTAHEAAHQWWANILLPGEGPGGNVLSEGAAHFSTILLFRHVKGEQNRMELCKRIETKYGDDRQVDSERPLVKILGDKAGDTTVTYDKGGWVLFMLHELMGPEASLAGIREFFDVYAGGPDFPVLQDYVAVLRKHAPDVEAYDAFVQQWFFDVVLPEYRVSDTAKEKSGDGWTATATVENAGTGRMPVEIAAVRGERFPEEGDADAEEWRDSRRTVVLNAGESAEVTLRCDFEPEEIVVDPDVELLMLEREKAVATL